MQNFQSYLYLNFCEGRISLITLDGLLNKVTKSTNFPFTAEFFVFAFLKMLTVL